MLPVCLLFYTRSPPYGRRCFPQRWGQPPGPLQRSSPSLLVLLEKPDVLATARLLRARQEPFVELQVQGARTLSFVSIVGGGG